MNEFNKEQIAKLTTKKSIPNFRAGDTLKVNIKVIEGERSRIQAFQGICIAKKNAGINSSFTVRKVSHGEGVERVFPIFSPIVSSIEVLRQGDVKRAKLYFLRNRSGKGARIADKDRGEEDDAYEISTNEETMIDEKIAEQGKNIESNKQTEQDKNIATEKQEEKANNKEEEKFKEQEPKKGDEPNK